MKEMRDPVTGLPWGELVRLEPDNALSFPGFSLKILNFAAGTGEEVITTPEGIMQFYQYRDQGFLLPLNPFIWEVRKGRDGRPLRRNDGGWEYKRDVDGGRILRWGSWESLPQIYREMMEQGGDIFGLPIRQDAQGLMVRRDLFRKVGLDPDHLPATWDELFDVCLRIGAATRGNSRGVLITEGLVEAYFLSAGGESARRVESADGRIHWESSADSPAMIQTVEFLRKLTLVRWIITPDGDPMVVWLPDKAFVTPHPALGLPLWIGNPASPAASLELGGRSYAPSEIFTGVALNQIGTLPTGSKLEGQDLFTATPPKIGLLFGSTENLATFTATMDPGFLGFGPVPAGAHGRGVFAQGQIGALNGTLKNDPDKARLAWAVLGFLASEEYRLLIARSFARESEGLAETLPPTLLKKAGLETIAERIPPSLQEFWKTLDASSRPVVPVKNFQAITNQYLFPVFRAASTDPDFEFRSALASAREQIQARLDFAMGDFSRVKHRRLILLAIAGILVAVLVGTCFAVRSMVVRAREDVLHQHTSGTRSGALLGWALLAPAMLLVSVFSYYPVFKALPIAFQDYTVAGPSPWIGAANFIEVFSNPTTWTSLLKTGYYLLLSIGFGFFAPIVLAVFMNEIRAFRTLLRTIYYLPAVVAGIVMLLLWQRFFEPTASGMVNSVYLRFGEVWNAVAPATLQLALQPVDWLRDPLWGIPSVVFIGVWGGMGPGMLIYLAALKSIPEEIYEAAEIDGASWSARFTHITLSYLRPLLIINLIGAVVAAFHASGNILALAGNFPATYTFAVHLWFETFGLGNFGVGTVLSWMMAAILVGVTIFHLRILRRVEFRRAQAD